MILKKSLLLPTIKQQLDELKEIHDCNIYAKKLANILNQAAQFSLKRKNQPKDKKNQRKEWFTPELRRCRNRLNTLCRQVQKYPQCSRLYELYNASKQRYIKLCKYQKYIYGRSQMQMLNDYTEENNNHKLIFGNASLISFGSISNLIIINNHRNSNLHSIKCMNTSKI